MLIRCLSVREPHASRIASGKKTIELRTWLISPGPLAIASTASKGKPGRLLCIVDVVECRDADEDDSERACVSLGAGDSYFAIVLGKITRVVQKDVVGKQGLWKVEVELC